ncbi:unnamed protein product [Caenorhabditis angaria]|uniref:40S ribosomal protein S19-binding protein 1 n=1 Tax=Caenorhabditis angaria TaxID=860376 RepID=A0A9P1IRZ7_9PELO|nr:unnamed protein product [Caenorhabditis angaria]
MSEELLQKFLSSVEQEDGISRKNFKKDKNSVARNNVKKILNAASKGHIELSAEESYIVQKPSTSHGDYVNDHLASQGFSLIEQARSYKPKDLKKRNLKYVKYQETRKLDSKKGKLLVNEHLKTKNDLKAIRKQKKMLIGVKEPRRQFPGAKSKKKEKSKSVFSEKDFAEISRAPKRLNTISDHSFI